MHGRARFARIRKYATLRRAVFVVLPAALVFWVAELWLAGWPCTLGQAVALPGLRLVSPRYESLVQPDEPSVAQVADHLRRIEPDASRRALLIPRVVRGLIWYRRDLDTHGQLDIAVTPTEMQALKSRRGWSAMYGDCDDYAVYGASVAAALGIPHRFNAAARHAWVDLQVQGEWRSMFANGQRGAAPAIGTWEPANGPAAFERELRADPPRAGSVRWLCDLPEDAVRGAVQPRRFRLGAVHGLAGLAAVAAGVVLERCHARGGRRRRTSSPEPEGCLGARNSLQEVPGLRSDAAGLIAQHE